jgi:poly-beta-1,6-N-acetyl-D-glucosamine synthase
LNYIFDFPNALSIIIGILFLVSAIISVFFYLYFFKPAFKFKAKQELPLFPPVSVIICAKNEHENLQRYLPLILEQDYPDFELIVVDDCSLDDTQDLLDQYSKKYPNLKHTRIHHNDKFKHSKKLALTIGIKAAKHEHLLMTDADCFPTGNQWIKHMASNFHEGKEIICGYGGYINLPGILNKLIRYEAVFTSMQYAGLAERGKPYMGVGRNLSYLKSLFFKNKGFASHLNLESGDDDLFISEIATSSNYCVEVNPESFTFSQPKTDFHSWFKQRKRHFTTGIKYKSDIKTLLLTEFTSRVILLASFIYLLIKNVHPEIVIGIFCIVFLTKVIVYKIILKRLLEKDLFLFSLFIEPFIPYIYTFIHFFNLLEKNRK